MVVAELVEWFVGSTAGQVGLAVGLLAVGLYWRKLVGAGSAAQSWGSRVVFSAVAVGALLLLGVITGVDVARATEIATMAWSRLVDLAQRLWEVLESWR